MGSDDEQHDEPVIRLRGARRTYGSGETEVQALREVDLEVPAGQLVVLLGPSGSGKTTLLNLIGGIDRADGGSVEVAGADVSRLDDAGYDAFRREHVSFIFQTWNLLPTLTAAENVELARSIATRPSTLGPEELLDNVGLAERGHHFPGQLSGGEQQRVAIARALSRQPHVLLCDEPTGSVDLETGRAILHELRRAHEEAGCATLIVTHNAAIARMADRVLHLRDGQIVEDELVESPLAPEDVEW